MPSDAIVLLGCRIEPNGRPSAAGRRRARAAARAFHAGRAPVVVASGGRRWFGHAEASALMTELVALGVPPQCIVEELCSLSTGENAHYVAEWARRVGKRRFIVVTCDWHLPRALSCFRRAGLDPEGEPAPAPRLPLHRGFVRSARERVSSLLDGFGTFGVGRRRSA